MSTGILTKILPVNNSEDNYAPGDRAVNFIHKARYTASNIGGALGGSRKYANRQDKAEERDKTVRAMAGIGADHLGIDKRQAQDAASTVVKLGTPVAKGLARSAKGAWKSARTKRR